MEPLVDDNWSQQLRELRHNPCLMAPLSALLLFLMGLVSIITLTFRMPELILAIVLAPIMAKTPWLIEFLYPTGLARWAHLFLVKLSSKKGRDKYHSRTLEQRIEVIPSAIYIHPISQLMDNLAYLIVSCHGDDGPLVGMLVDCGDAKECIEQLDLIRERHYNNRELQMHAILCTHKHHDHTAGNAGLVKKYSGTLTKVYGAVAERVPLANHFVSNQDMLQLPKIDGNDMNAFVSAEVICVPGHTRGSVAFALRTKNAPHDHHASFLFTGDTMFSAGGGVPFEADQAESTAHQRKKKVGSYIRASAGSNAIERCFVELTMRAGTAANVLIFPGHEYSNELLNRQFRPSAESTSWNRFAPSVFFRTASQLYVASHRRSLPTGKILAVPTLLSLEKDINPHFRKLHKRGEDVVRAIQLWYRVFARNVIENEGKGVVIKATVSKTKRTVGKEESSEDIWNVTADDISKPIFTAIYTADLDIIIHELDSGELNLPDAMEKLKLMRNRAELPVLNRRPIPGTLPDDKVMYSALLGLVILGTPPTAMTISDSRSMNLPRPVSPANTHKIKVSKSRVVKMLKFLDLISDTIEGRDLNTMIDYLWKEAADYGMPEEYKATLADGELGLDGDDMELGVLRWMLFGVEANQPTWFERYCMPCNTPPPSARKHPINDARLRRTNGELVKHDALTCPLCRDATGCPLSGGIEKEEEIEDFPDNTPITNCSSNGAAPSVKPSANPEQTIRLQFPAGGLRRGNSQRPFDEEDDDESSVEVQMMLGANAM